MKEILTMKISANYTKTQTWNKDLKAGDKLEGLYTHKEVFEGKFGQSTKYVVKFDGDDWGVYGSASLDRQFANIPEGSYVWIEYQGEVQTKNGRTVKQYKVEYDTDIKSI